MAGCAVNTVNTIIIMILLSTAYQSVFSVHTVTGTIPTDCHTRYIDFFSVLTYKLDRLDQRNLPRVKITISPRV